MCHGTIAAAGGCDRPVGEMILKDGFIQPERLSLVTLDRPTHCPMGSRRGDPAADAATLTYKKRNQKQKDDFT